MIGTITNIFLIYKIIKTIYHDLRPILEKKIKDPKSKWNQKDMDKADKKFGDVL